MTAFKNTDKFFLRKTKEISIVASAAGVTNSRKVILNASLQKLNWPKLALRKLSIRDAYWQKKPTHCDFETNLTGPQIFMQNSFRYEYSYQRIDLKYLDPIRKIYPRFTAIKLHEQRIHFTHSAQAALSILFNTLREKYRIKKIIALTPVYWETHSFLLERKWNLKHLSAAKVYFIDSSMTVKDIDFYLAQVKKKADLLVVDTTCWALDSAEIKKIHFLYKHLRLNVILVRSHLNLDSLGTEWCRLGSICFSIGKNQSKLSNFIQNYFWNSRYYGNFIQPGFIYPFLGSGKFLKASRQWALAMRKNQKYVVDHIRPHSVQLKSVEVQDFSHGIFFWIIFEKPKKDFYSKTLRYHLKQKNVVHAQLTSYPWDVLSITEFSDRSNLLSDGRKAATVLRISVPDCDKTELVKTAEAFAGFFTHLKILEENL